MIAGKESNKSSNNVQTTQDSSASDMGPFSIKSYRNYNQFQPLNRHSSRVHDDNHNASGVLSRRGSDKFDLAGTVDFKNANATGDAISNGVLDDLGLTVPEWASYSLPVTARKNPYVQLEPLTDRSSSTLSLFKHSQGSSSSASKATASEPQPLNYTTSENKNSSYRSQLSNSSKTSTISTSNGHNINNNNTLKLSSHNKAEYKPVPALRSLGQVNHWNIQPQSQATAIPEPATPASKLGALPSFGCNSASSGLTRGPIEASKSRSRSVEYNGVKAASKSNSNPPGSLSAGKVFSDGSTVSGKRSHEVPYIPGGTFPPQDGSIAPPNIYTYFAVFSSMPGIGSGQTGADKKDTNAPNRIKKKNIGSGDHDNQSADEPFNVDRLVSSLAQNLTSVDSTSGSTVGSTIAKRHARYK